MLKDYTDFMSKFEDILYKFEDILYKLYGNLKFNVTWIMKLFSDNGIVKFHDELVQTIGGGVTIFLELLAIWLKNKSDPEDSDLDLPDPDEDKPGPEGGDSEPGPNGDDSEPEDNDSNKKKLDKGKGKAITPEAIPEENEYNDNKLDKGKGKAKAITPEVIPEENKEAFTDYDEKFFQNDLERARLNSLKEGTKGESSKQGATLQEREDEEARLNSLRENRGESSTQGTSLGQNESAETQKEVVLSYDYYCEVSESRRAIVRNFNDITMKLNSKHTDMSPEQRAFLLEESVQLKEQAQNYDAYINSIKKMLDIPSDDQGNYPNNSSEESTSEYYSSSSEEESRPNKRPKK